jgi:phytoene synthase
LILGLEMSRLARSCKDWHTLLDLCAIYRTLLDEIQRGGFRVLTQRTSLTPLRKFWIAWRTWVAA